MFRNTSRQPAFGGSNEYEHYLPISFYLSDEKEKMRCLEYSPREAGYITASKMLGYSKIELDRCYKTSAKIDFYSMEQAFHSTKLELPSIEYKNVNYYTIFLKKIRQKEKIGFIKLVDKNDPTEEVGVILIKDNVIEVFTDQPISIENDGKRVLNVYSTNRVLLKNVFKDSHSFSDVTIFAKHLIAYGKIKSVKTVGNPDDAKIL